ncbi:MAG: hypothetical protein K1X28_07970 [Parachlamydiales bacterium]|nr:hypothetical protein [Parachlamydiales bacterium]
MIKKTSLAAFLLYFGSAACICDSRIDSGMMNVSSYPNIDSNQWDVWCDATFWKAMQGGTEWAAENFDKGDSGLIRLKKVHFNYEWGFKVGIGYNLLKHDEWDTQFYYTWFRAEQRDSGRLEEPATLAFYPGMNAFFAVPDSINGSYLNSGDILWSIKYNMLDWELGRGYMVSIHLSLRPHFGLKGGEIRQNINGHYTSFDDEKIWFKSKNHFTGIGPSIGVNSRWEFGSWKSHSFSLFGDFGGAWMAGHWDVRSSFGGDEPTVTFDHLSQNRSTITAQAFMGLAWDANFHYDQCHFSARLGYEAQQWFNQLRLFLPGETFRYNYDLMLQGATFDVRLDF